MTPTNKFPIQDEPKKPTFVALIKKNKPEPSPESSPKPEETSPHKTSSQSRGKKSTSSTTKSQQSTASTSSTAKSQQTTASTSSTTKSKQTTASTSSKQTEKTTISKATEKSQSTTTPKAVSQSSSKTSSKKPSNPTTQTQKVTPSTASQNRITASQNNQKGQGKSPKTQSTTNNKPQSTISQKTEDKAQSTTNPKTQSTTQKKTQSTISQKTEDKAQSTTNPKTQDKSPTSQLKNANIDPIQKALLYQNKKKQRLGISDYQDQVSARDLSLSITGITSVAAGGAVQTFLAGSLMGIFSLPALLLFSALFAKNAFEFHRTALDIQREEDAEKKIAQLLKDTYLETGGGIYSLLDENPLIIPDPEGYRQDYLDIGLFLPSGQFLAISVKSLKGEKDFVYIDQKTNTLRYRNPHGLKRWKVNPIDELRRQMDWLCENSQIFKQTPLGIVVFMTPARLKTFDDVAYQIGEIKILELDNILIVREEDLLTLINEVISRRKV